MQMFLILISFTGFALAFYIHHTKRSNEKLICPLNLDCDAVIYSNYSKFWGMPVEILGLVYYGLIAVSYISLEIFPFLAVPTVIFILLGVSIVAFMFSLYLTFIQAFNLRQWCTWCLISAGICISIFALSLTSSQFSLNSLLTQHRIFVSILHLFGVALGLGGATIADIMFMKSLKDFRISEIEADVLHTLSQVIWFALAVLLLSGVGLYIPHSETLIYSSKFLAKMVIFSVIIVNGSLLNLIISPKLVKISFGGKHDHESGELVRLRKLSFALGFVSIISWYSAFILGSLRSVPLGVFNILLIYFGVLILGVVASQLLESWFIKTTN